MCIILNTPTEVKKIWSRKLLMPRFRASMTAWIYEYAKNHKTKNGRVYSSFQLDIVSEAFKRAFVTHRKAATLAAKKTLRTIDSEKKEVLQEVLARNMILCVHDSFCRSKETTVDPLH